MLAAMSDHFRSYLQQRARGSDGANAEGKGSVMEGLLVPLSPQALGTTASEAQGAPAA